MGLTEAIYLGGMENVRIAIGLFLAHLLVCSALTDRLLSKNNKEKCLRKRNYLVGRICVIIISVTALIPALDPSDTILAIYARGAALPGGCRCD